MKRRIDILLLMTLLLPLIGKGQEAAFRVPLDPVDSTGFYAIPLKPELSVLLDADREKLRLRSGEEEVPFFKSGADIEEQEADIKELKILEQKEEGSISINILQAPENNEQPIILYTQEPDSSKRFKVEGSEERNEWETVMEERRIRSSVMDTSSSEFHIPNFLDEGYEHYRIKLRDASGSAPEVVAIGRSVEKDTGKTAFWELPRPEFQQEEKAEKSIVRIQMDTLRSFDRMELKLDGPPFFRRRALLRIKKEEERGRVMGDEILNDTSGAIEDIRNEKSKRFLLSIEKGPDPPLKIQEIRLFQRKRFMIAHLEKGKDYELRMGGALQEAPEYEIREYRDRIPKALPLLNSKGPLRIEQKNDAKDEKGALIWVWITLILAIVLIGTFTYRMVENRNKEA